MAPEVSVLNIPINISPKEVGLWTYKNEFSLGSLRT